MKPWYEDENFWLRFAPVLFNSSRWSTAADEMEQAVRLLELLPGAHILDACCGVGRHSIELARMGYRVSALDFMPQYLEAAQETADAEGFDIEFIHNDIRAFFHPFEYDAAVSMFTSIGYFDDPEEEKLALSNIRMSLKHGGRLLVDVIGKEVVAREFKRLDWYEDGDTGIVLSEYRIIENWSKLENHWIVINGNDRFEYTFAHRLYSAVELEHLLKEAGFTYIRFFGDLAGSPYDEKAQQLIAIAEN